MDVPGFSACIVSAILNEVKNAGTDDVEQEAMNVLPFLSPLSCGCQPAGHK